MLSASRYLHCNYLLTMRVRSRPLLLLSRKRDTIIAHCLSRRHWTGSETFPREKVSSSDESLTNHGTLSPIWLRNDGTLPALAEFLGRWNCDSESQRFGASPGAVICS